MKKRDDNSRILIISDMHCPYQHRDYLRFLQALKDKYNFTRIICVGDEVDKHAMSFHDSDPDLMSAGDELRSAIKALKPLYKLFPNVDLVSSNHGDMVYRKGKHHGIPRKYLKDYGDVLEAPKGWKWHVDLTLSLPNKEKLYVHHGLSKKALTVAQGMGMNHVCGHFHNDFKIEYASSPSSLLWAMTVGCLIDDSSLAFAYNKNNLGRPIIGVGIVIDGHPRLIPMILNRQGRWIGRLV